MTGLHPLLAGRWSPTAFDGAAEVTDEEAATLLEAARWAPSAGNSQPWAFVLARRGTADHERLSARLAPSARRWAPQASLLVVNLCHRWVEGTDLAYSEFSLYDLGQAVAHMTVQARAMGLYVRQFRAFDREGVAADFEVSPGWQVSTMSAIGSVVPAAPGEPQRPEEPRVRRAGDDLVWPRAGVTER